MRENATSPAPIIPFIYMYHVLPFPPELCPVSQEWTSKGGYCEFDGTGISNLISKIYIAPGLRSGVEETYTYTEAESKCSAWGATLVREPDMLDAVRCWCQFIHFTIVHLLKVCFCQLKDSSKRLFPGCENYLPHVARGRGLGERVVPRLRESRLLTPSGRGRRVHAT